MNMIVNYQTDESGRLQSVTVYPLDATKPTLELPDDFDLRRVRDYVLNGGAMKHDPFVDMPSAAEQIAALKQKLAETDYITAKAVDAMIAADSLTSLLAALKSIHTEYVTVFAQRAAWRKEINDLEEKGDDA
nr:MAG TPA: hypothetical protein [Caudoviricetes sp.]